MSPWSGWQLSGYARTLIVPPPPIGQFSSSSQVVNISCSLIGLKVIAPRPDLSSLMTIKLFERVLLLLELETVCGPFSLFLLEHPPHVVFSSPPRIVITLAFSFKVGHVFTNPCTWLLLDFQITNSWNFFPKSLKNKRNFYLSYTWFTFHFSSVFANWMLDLVFMHEISLF